MTFEQVQNKIRKLVGDDEASVAIERVERSASHVKIGGVGFDVMNTATYYVFFPTNGLSDYGQGFTLDDAFEAAKVKILAMRDEDAKIGEVAKRLIERGIV